ncbi:MAG: DUF177 domain-containing protein [Microlunatus sp.]|nr:DUF177 domain-containing protein [Microlunatus sp.]MDN5770332.1 DUF177 domain-containing protein [Microlunatus sp.]
MREVRTIASAPPDLGIAVIGVPEGSPLKLDLRLEAVVEGVLVTGTASATLQGECVRCLTQLSDEVEVDVQELFSYDPIPAAEEDDDESSHLDGELLDLEPVLRDAVVLELPFQPVCRLQCRGLCSTCGIDLNAVESHSHDEAIDPRWAGLARFGSEEETS